MFGNLTRFLCQILCTNFCAMYSLAMEGWETTSFPIMELKAQQGRKENTKGQVTEEKHKQ